ncbi:MAG: hypothetical protein KGI49_02085 [Patescibacteria group bacterium]|nr:hypothetical protein [Patescibacteria group bacterium]
MANGSNGSNGTKWTLYASNEDAWSAMLSDCAKAERSIVLEQFIFYADDFGRRLMNVCAERAKAGVEVRFLWDAVGSWSLWGSNIAEELRLKGIKLVFWKTLVPDYTKVPEWRHWFLRNHRRNLVIDRKIGYTGSICVSGKHKDWRDTNVRLEGTVARQMENSFDRMWDRAVHSRPLPKRLKYKDSDFRYETNYPAPGRRRVYAAFAKAVREAEEKVWVTAPYFVPTHRMIRLLKSAAERGVDVRILLPERSNYFVVDLGARTYFDTLLESGVKIFLYTANFIHSKTMVVDDSWASVGSMNWDRLSLLYNFEANVISVDPRFNAALAGHFRTDMAASREVTLSAWRRRSLLERWKELPAYFMRKLL